MNQRLCDLAQTKSLIESGASLLLAGEEKLLADLPAGHWIGGTIPYFIGQDGGVFTKERIFVTELPDYIEKISIVTYAKDALSSVYRDGPGNGFSFIILPGMSEIHLSFALGAPDYPAFATRPLVGWISGVDLDLVGRVTPKVMDGSSRRMLEESAVVMHVTLPPGKTSDLGIINIFKQGSGDALRFPKSNFSATEAMVNGERLDFVDYVQNNELDTKLPLVADYAGAMINTSFQKVDVEKREVAFYSPVFKGAEYRQAAPFQDYIQEFTSQMPSQQEGRVIFACNCILNYLYSELESKKTGEFVGPITFGEIAYQLLNQTLVYLQIIDT